MHTIKGQKAHAAMFYRRKMSALAKFNQAAVKRVNSTAFPEGRKGF